MDWMHADLDYSAGRAFHPQIVIPVKAGTQPSVHVWMDSGFRRDYDLMAGHFFGGIDLAHTRSA